MAMRRFRLPWVSLLSSLGASILCSGSAIRTHAEHQASAPPSAPHPSRLKQIALLSNKRQAAPPQAEKKKLKIGDVTIADFNTNEGVLGSGEFHLLGPYTEITVPDKASKSVLHVHADDIQGSRIGKIDGGLITLIGNVRYRLVQQSDEGERILEGTAGRAILERTKQHMEFTGGTHATLTDAARFSGPATLRTDSLNVAMKSKPARYTLEGAAANNDIRFTPMQTPTVKAGTKLTAADPPGAKPAATPLGTVHIYSFRSGDVQFGEAIHFQGATTTCEFASPDDKTSWRLQGEQFEGEFVPTTSDLQRATVTENVKFHVLQPSADKKVKTTADGTATQASFVRTKAGQEMLAHGPIRVDFTDPEHLEEPMVLTSGPKSILTVKKAGGSLSYRLDDPEHKPKLDIVPKPFAVDEAKPVTPPKPK